MKKYLLTIIVFFIFYSPIVKSDDVMIQMKLDRLLDEVMTLREEVYNLKKQINNDVYYWVWKNNSFLYGSIVEIVKSDLSKEEREKLFNEWNKNMNEYFDKDFRID
jgi:hypothetical protein|tara:strand:- start:220 stop:537 length:318 start_codon:yes stop_codon:yes gene_type:complete